MVRRNCAVTWRHIKLPVLTLLHIAPRAHRDARWPREAACSSGGDAMRGMVLCEMLLATSMAGRGSCRCSSHAVSLQHQTFQHWIVALVASQSQRYIRIEVYLIEPLILLSGTVGRGSQILDLSNGGLGASTTHRVTCFNIFYLHLPGTIAGTGTILRGARRGRMILL